MNDVNTLLQFLHTLREQHTEVSSNELKEPEPWRLEQDADTQVNVQALYAHTDYSKEAKVENNRREDHNLGDNRVVMVHH